MFTILVLLFPYDTFAVQLVWFPFTLPPPPYPISTLSLLLSRVGMGLFWRGNARMGGSLYSPFLFVSFRFCLVWLVVFLRFASLSCCFKTPSPTPLLSVLPSACAVCFCAEQRLSSICWSSDSSTFPPSPFPSPRWGLASYFVFLFSFFFLLDRDSHCVRVGFAVLCCWCGLGLWLGWFAGLLLPPWPWIWCRIWVVLVLCIGWVGRG
ncbi:hypothetical protein BT67DRAFT_82679 [Trichocladium antarcticum]|uniref:Uncharacterized protein n=1 Tax=Trichocladium antarcticum TaxID=1450529 RepID=A0AAN6UGJ3_9PEZI|nr:hypothetical protein BT67DRAFT_82679 [Trichocladium antarcticum]